jgi:Kef-type K+ transport system membrane component KefB
MRKSPDLHFTLIVGMVIAAVGLAAMLKVSVILALLAFGLFTRNDERRHDLLNVNLEPASRPLYIVLFVITGASLPAFALLTGVAGGAAILAARTAAKLLGVAVFAPAGGLRVRQAIGLGCSLMPMSTLALMLHYHVVQQVPSFNPGVASAMLAAIIMMEVAGPIAVQWGLGFAGETEPAPRRAVEATTRPAAATSGS